MNITTIFGILFGTLLLVFAISFGISGNEVIHIDKPWAIFVNIPGLFIVLGGTMAATFISFPSKTISRVFNSLATVFRRELRSPTRYIKEITRLAALARSGALTLEKELPRIRNPFLRDGVQMLADEFEPAEITEIMRQRTDFRTRKELEEAKKRYKRIFDKYHTAGSRVPGQLIQPPSAISDSKALTEIKQAQHDVDKAELKYREAIRRLSSGK